MAAENEALLLSSVAAFLLSQLMKSEQSICESIACDDFWW